MHWPIRISRLNDALIHLLHVFLGQVADVRCFDHPHLNLRRIRNHPQQALHVVIRVFLLVDGGTVAANGIVALQRLGTIAASVEFGIVFVGDENAAAEGVAFDEGGEGHLVDVGDLVFDLLVSLIDSNPCILVGP